MNIEPTHGAKLILTERTRQMREEHYDSVHDDSHTEGELIHAAIRYAFESNRVGLQPSAHDDFAHRYNWPWDESEWKPLGTGPLGSISRHDAVRMLTIAGALIAAEIDRLERYL